MRRIAAAGTLVLLLTTTGCGEDDGPGHGDGARPRTGRTSFSAGGVEVRVELARRTAGRGELLVTLRPAAGFNLYGTDLPRGGVDGLGQRTELRTSGALRASGRLRANRSSRPLRVRGVRRPLRAYPAGPVRLRLPVRRTGAGPAAAVLSFGACSARSCGPPVVDRRVPLEER